MNETIAKIIDLLKDENCQRMNKSTLKGYLGELMVFKKLINEGIVPSHKGNQSGYDIEIPNSAKIDVKFSTLDTRINYWGWALVPRSKKREISCSHFVCVAANLDFTINAYYIINKENIDDFPRVKGRFNNVKSAFSVAERVGIKEDYFITCEELIKSGKVKKILPEDNLAKYL